MPTLTVLVAGLGAVGQRHVRNLRRLLGGDVEILAHRTRRQAPLLTDNLDVESGGSVEDRYGVRSIDDLDRALGLRPDAVFVCNPSSLHLTTALAGARAGAHLFIEKPLADRLDGVDDLQQEVRDRKLVAVVGYQLRFHPCLQRLERLLMQRAVGRLLTVQIATAEHLPYWHRYEDYRSSYAARRELGGGVVLSQIHELDYAQWLFGMPRRLFAVGGHLSQLDVNVEDTASILMDVPCDGRTLPIHVHQDFVQKRRVRRCRVVGEDGVIAVDLLASTLAVTNAEGRQIDGFAADHLDRNDLFLAEVRHFVACVRGEETPRVPIDEGVRSLRIALAARESLTTGRVMELSR